MNAVDMLKKERFSYYDLGYYTFQYCIVMPVCNTKRYYDRLSDEEKDKLYNTLRSAYIDIAMAYKAYKFVRNFV